MQIIIKILNSRWIILIPFALYLLIVTLQAATKMPWCDEAWFASSAVNLVRNGFMGNTVFVDGGGWLHLDHYTFWQPPLYFLAEALTFKLFGIGLFQIHLVSIFWGLAGLVAIYLLAKYIFGDNKRWLLCILIVSIGTELFYLSRAADGRMDMMAAALSFMAFALYLSLREKHFYWAIFLGNLCVCLSGLTHPNGLLGFLVVVFLMVFLDRKRLNLKVIGIGLIPYALSIVGWGAYIIQDYAAFKAQFFGNAIRSDTLKWSAIVHELTERYLKTYGVLPFTANIRQYAMTPILLFYWAILIAVPFFIKDKKQWMLWGMLVIYFLGLMFISGNKTSAYLAWITPFFLMNSISIWQTFKWRTFANVFFPLALAYIFLISIYANYQTITGNDYRNKYLHDLSVFNTKYYHGGKIYGSGEITFFYNFNDNILQDDPGLGYNTGIKPDYFAVEIRYKSWFETFKKDSPDKWLYIESTLSKEYTKVFDGKFYTFYKRK